MNNDYLLGAGYYPAKLTKLFGAGYDPAVINEESFLSGSNPDGMDEQMATPDPPKLADTKGGFCFTMFPFVGKSGAKGTC